MSRKEPSTIIGILFPLRKTYSTLLVKLIEENWWYNSWDYIFLQLYWCQSSGKTELNKIDMSDVINGARCNKEFQAEKNWPDSYCVDTNFEGCI